MLLLSYINFESYNLEYIPEFLGHPYWIKKNIRNGRFIANGSIFKYQCSYCGDWHESTLYTRNFKGNTLKNLIDSLDKDKPLIKFCPRTQKGCFTRFRAKQVCKIHGKESMSSAGCTICIQKSKIDSFISSGGCKIHPDAKPSGSGKCASCEYESRVKNLKCSKHKDAKFTYTGKCVKCAYEERVANFKCEKHPEAFPTASGECSMCQTEYRTSLKCKIHKNTKLNAYSQCAVCIAEKNNKIFYDNGGCQKHPNANPVNGVCST